MTNKDYLHQILELQEGEVVEVHLSGNAANVMLLDPTQFEDYKNRRPFHYLGGYITTSPARIETPAPGRWHLVIDLGGGPGRVQASLLVHPAETVAEGVGVQETE